MVVLRGGSGGKLVGNKSLQNETKKKKWTNALTAESDRCTATHRARKSKGTARLFKSLCILGGIKQGSACVNTDKLCVSLLACQSLASPPCTLETGIIRGKKRFFSACCAVVALAEASSCPGSGTVRLYCPPLTSPLLDLQTCPGRIYFHTQGAVIPPPLHLHHDSWLNSSKLKLGEVWMTCTPTFGPKHTVEVAFVIVFNSLSIKKTDNLTIGHPRKGRIDTCCLLSLWCLPCAWGCTKVWH